MITASQQLGHGPKITMIHGWAMHSGLFNALAHELARHYTVDGVDLPGHGQGREVAWPKHTHALLDALADQADGGTLLGWSLGGLLAMMTALHRPDSVSRLVLIAATPCFAKRPHWPHAVATPMVNQLAHDLANGPESLLNRFLALEVHGSEHAARDLRLLRHEAFRYGLPDQAALLQGLDLLRETDLSGELANLHQPTLLIGGRRDRLVPFEALEATAQRLDDARLVRIPGAAHAPFLTDTALVAETLRHWLNETDTSS